MTLTLNAMWVRDPSKPRGPVGTLTLPTEMMRGEPGLVTFEGHGGLVERWHGVRVMERALPRVVVRTREGELLFVEVGDDAERERYGEALERLECDGAPVLSGLSRGGWFAAGWPVYDGEPDPLGARYRVVTPLAHTLARLFDQRWPAMAPARCRTCSGPAAREGLCDECALTTCEGCYGTGSRGWWDDERRAMVDGACNACGGSGRPPAVRARVLTPAREDRCSVMMVQPVCSGACGYVEPLRKTLAKMGDDDGPERGELALIAEDEAWLAQVGARRQADGRVLIATPIAVEAGERVERGQMVTIGADGLVRSAGAEGGE